MADRLIQAAIHKDRMQAVCDTLREVEPRNWWRGPAPEDDDYEQVFIVLHASRVQEVIDAIQDQMQDRDDWRLVVLAVEAAAPKIEDEEEQERLRSAETTSAREEIYASVSEGAALSLDFIVMTLLALVVAAIGLNTDQLAVVIGAMVIAPLLGPIVAFGVGTALGDVKLLWRAAKSLGVGIGLGLALSLPLGLVVPVNLDSSLLDYGATIRITSVVLPLASGAAAAVMVARGDNSNMVGVMVAAALLPPLAATGLLLGAQQYLSAFHALSLVVINVVAITLAAQLVFIWKGVRPSRWLNEDHKNSVLINIGTVAALLGLIVALLYLLPVLWN
jgi:uncharacterized hydrophobic protein (TIGR00341 family)